MGSKTKYIFGLIASAIILSGIVYYFFNSNNASNSSKNSADLSDRNKIEIIKSITNADQLEIINRYLSKVMDDKSSDLSCQTDNKLRDELFGHSINLLNDLLSRKKTCDDPIYNEMVSFSCCRKWIDTFNDLNKEKETEKN